MTKKERKKWFDDALSLQKELSNPDLTKPLYADENGDFKPSVNLPDGQINIGYVEQIILWAYTHADFSVDEKLERILAAESIINDILKDMGINYIPNYSTKLKTENKCLE